MTASWRTRRQYTRAVRKWREPPGFSETSAAARVVPLLRSKAAGAAGES